MHPGESFPLLDYGFYGIGKTCMSCIETQSCLLQNASTIWVLAEVGHQMAVLSFTNSVLLLPRPVGMTNDFHPPVLRVHSIIIFWFIKRHFSIDSPPPDVSEKACRSINEQGEQTLQISKVVWWNNASGHLERNLLTEGPWWGRHPLGSAGVSNRTTHVFSKQGK